MKAVILAAGKGVRMRPLTRETPKPLLKINGKPILDYIFESLPAQITEVIMVIKYHGKQIQEYSGSSKNGKMVHYVTGSNKGTAYSLISAQKYLSNERFLLLYGDEIPNPIDINRCLEQDLSILVFTSHTPHSHGMVYLRSDGTVKTIIEKPKTSQSKIAIDGIMVLHSDIFKCIPSKDRGEKHVSTMISQFAQTHAIVPIKASHFIGDLTTAQDIARVEHILKFSARRHDTQLDFR